MAKLKEKINELKSKYGITEDAAREVLALHDGDLQEANAVIAQEQNKVVEWNKFWFEKSPQIEALAQEYAALKAQMDAIKSATGTNYQPQPVTPSTPTQPQNQNVDELEQRIYRNFSAVQKDLYKIQQYHLENYGKLPDLEPIEKLIETQKVTPWKAYEQWVAPMDADRKEKALRAQITQELTEKMRNDATRSGVNSYLLSNKNSVTGEEVVSPLDEALREDAAKVAAAPKQTDAAAPSEFELLTDFVQSMRQGRSGVAH